MQKINQKYLQFYQYFYVLKLTKEKKIQKKLNLKKNSLKFFFITIFKSCYSFKKINFEKYIYINNYLYWINVFEHIKLF